MTTFKRLLMVCVVLCLILAANTQNSTGSTPATQSNFPKLSTLSKSANNYLTISNQVDYIVNISSNYFTTETISNTNIASTETQYTIPASTNTPKLANSSPIANWGIILGIALIVGGCLLRFLDKQS